MIRRKKLTQKEFDAAIAKLPAPMSNRLIARAHRVLVDGEAQTAVADEEGLTVQAVTSTVTKVWRSHVNQLAVPKGMEKIEAVLTTQQANVVRDWARENVYRRTTDANDSDS